MPVAIPIIGAAAGLAASSAVAGLGIGGALFGAGLIGSIGSAIVADTVIGSLAGFVVSTAVNAVGSRAFSPKASAATATADIQSRAQMVTNDAQVTHKILYGEVKVSGVVEDLGVTSSGPVPYGPPKTGTNIFRHFIVILSGHEVDSIGTVYFNDVPLTLDSRGYANCLPYVYYPASQTGITQTISSAVRSDEIVTVTTAAPHGFTNGDLVSVAVTTDLSMNGKFIITSIPSSTTFTYVNGGENASASGGSVTDETIAGTYNSYIRIIKHVGTSDQTADTDMISEINGWDSTHRLRGLSYLYIRLEYNQDVFSTGIQNVSAIVRGKRVYDPRTGDTVWSNNAALCTRDYLASDYGFNCSASEINDDYFTAAANICDESVTLTTGGSQSRYTCNGVLDTATIPIDNLNALVASMAGTVTYVQGLFRAYAGSYDATVADITLDMLAGDISIRPRVTRQQLFNAVQGTFIDPTLGYAATDFPPVTNPTYEADDGGIQLLKNIQLPLTNHQEAAQRIAKVILEQGRQGMTIQLTLNHYAIPLAVWDTVTFTDPTMGWDHKVFRIKNFNTSGIGPVVLSLQEESSSSYDWDAGEATILDSAPDTNLPDPFTIAGVTGLSYTSRPVTTTDNDTLYNLVLTWASHADVFVTSGGEFEIQFKLSSDTDWRPSFFVSGEHTFADIVSSSINTNYDARIRAISGLGVRSAWTEIDHIIIGSSGGAGTFLDWGSVADAVGPTNDYGNAADPVGATDDWGSVV